MKCLVILLFALLSTDLNAQIKHLEPPNWWVGFKDQQLQLLVNADNIGGAKVKIEYAGVELLDTHNADSPNYLFLNLQINQDAKAGKFNIEFLLSNGKKLSYTYELKSRENKPENLVGFNSSDVIYLITPDRFANGNLGTDVVKGLKENSIDRNNDYARHGGDIRGMINHLDYIDDMGFTALWSSPLLINDMPSQSYHGYAITDYYKVDPRFGSLDDYIELSNKSRSKGIKLIMDQVANHCGLGHWWMKDLPFKDWVNNQEDFSNNTPLSNSNHRRTTNQDLYASNYDEELLSNGWFVSGMPDLNQRNKFLATYIIQNSLWWIETLQLGGIRQDTYPYPDKKFMANWAGTIMNEYPNFNIVGEEWSYNPLLVGYWQHGAVNKDGYESNLKTTMDFPMQSIISQALNETEEWDRGLIKIYEGLANDFHYADPESIMIFSDNHDMDRILTQLHEDVENTKMAMSLILTLPRIPQIYYGTEILMQNSARPGDHGLIRTDFPGGWKDDEVNAFTGKNLTPEQKDMQSFMKTLLNYRKTSKALSEGKTTHFAPYNGIYALFRVIDEEIVMVIINKNDEPIELDLNKFNEIGLQDKTVKNIISGESFTFGETLLLSGKGSILLTTKL
ncbi:Glycosidase [Flavobacteriaceae bacterium MAR_2010_188]|nr:Glycosidase [Flavobacteriaceae bacterium MAR_2010_188]